MSGGATVMLKEVGKIEEGWPHWDHGWWSSWSWWDEDRDGAWWNDYRTRDHTTSWPSSTSSTRDGRLSNTQLRNFNVADVAATTAVLDGRWNGPPPTLPQSHSTEEDHGNNTRSSEKLTVPEFCGEGSDSEVGKTARSYVRKIQAWVRSTKLPPTQRALALYSALKDRAWVYAEELDIDRLGSEEGMGYYLDWVQTRFMDVEVSKISQMMTDLFRRCRRCQDQSVRDFNVEFERMVLRLHEVRCDLPPLVKAWLYLDKLRLSETEELALLASVGNEYDVRRLQQAALIQDKALRRGIFDKSNANGKFGAGRWSKSVHMTNDDASSDEGDEGLPIVAEEDLVDEDTAMEQHTAFMAYQGAKAKYREAARGRGTDPAALQRASEERLRLAKQRSYCSVCKRRGHWHKDAECPANQQKKQLAEQPTQSAQMCYYVHMTDSGKGTTSWKSSMLAIVDTACTRSVAGYKWFEQYYKLADQKGIQVVTVDLKDTFKFGASRVFESSFAVWAWFAVMGRWFAVRVSIVHCDVPLLLSRSVLAGLEMKLDVAGHHATLDALGLEKVILSTSNTGHPALEVSQFPDSKPPFLAAKATEEIWLPPSDVCAYREPAVIREFRPLFYPKKISNVVQNMLEEKGTLPGATFFAWWKSANQSRDFWIETKDEMIRIHVCPRKDAFDPSKWNTTLTDLKGSLLQLITGKRVTEIIPCLNEGIQVETLHSDSFHDSLASTRFGLWIGRSRFVKYQATCSPPVVHLTDVQDPVAMEPSQGRADCGTASPGHCRARELVCAGASHSVGGAPSVGWTGRPCGSQGDLQDVTPATGGRVPPFGHQVAGEANSGSHDAADPRHEEVTGPHGDVIRPLQGLALQRSPQGLPGVGCGRDKPSGPRSTWQ